MISKSANKYEFTVDMLPRPCFSYNSTHMTLALNDLNKQSQSSLLAGTKFTVNVFGVISDLNPFKAENLAVDPLDFFRPTLKRIFSAVYEQNLASPDVFAAPLKDGEQTFHKFFVEITFNYSSSSCPLANMCIDESSVKNEIVCVDHRFCKKLVAYFQINESARIYNKLVCLLKDSEPLRNILEYFNENGKSRSSFDKDAARQLGTLKSDFVGFALVDNLVNIHYTRLPIYLIDFSDSIDFSWTVRIDYMFAILVSTGILAVLAVYVIVSIFKFYEKGFYRLYTISLGYIMYLYFS